MSMKIAHRTLDCFEVFLRSRRPLTLTELAAALDAPMSSSFALVKALKDRGYLYSLGAREGYYPTRKMLAVAEGVAAHDPISELFGPVLAELRDATEETAVLSKRQDDTVIYLMVADGPRSIRFNAEVGRIVPMHTSATGKALLGALDTAELDATLAKLVLTRQTRASITDRKKLRANVREGQQRGYYVAMGENVEDVMALASTVLVVDEPYAIAVAGPIQRMAELRDKHVRRLLDACTRLSKLQAPAGLRAKRSA
jgi:IclR family acetate operon transcriptional repressor